MFEIDDVPLQTAARCGAFVGARCKPQLGARVDSQKTWCGYVAMHIKTGYFMELIFVHH